MLWLPFEECKREVRTLTERLGRHAPPRMGGHYGRLRCPLLLLRRFQNHGPQTPFAITIGIDNAECTECIFDDVCNKHPAGTMGARQSRGDLAASGSLSSSRSRPARCRAVKPPSETSFLTEVPTSENQSPLGWTLKYRPIGDRPRLQCPVARPPKLGDRATADSKPDGTHT